MTALAIKNYLPRSLLGRSLLIIVTPLFLLQVVAALFFYESHWDTVSWRLARNLAGDMAILVDAVDGVVADGRGSTAADAHLRDWALQRAAYHLGIFGTLRRGEVLPEATKDDEPAEPELARALAEHLHQPYRITTNADRNQVIVDVQVTDGVLHMVTSRKRLFTATVYVFVIWMVGTSILLLAVAVVFMRNQVKPILRLARAADAFGKGRDTPRFKPEGAREVRQAAAAFLAMRERIRRQIGQRTAMLAGVSHDLRTPLTRMKLELELMTQDDGVSALKEDVIEMERMLEGYLAFARGEDAERPEAVELKRLLDEVVRHARRQGRIVDLRCPDGIEIAVKPLAFRRILTNLIDNALRFGSRVWLRAVQVGEMVEVLIEDDGPGIPAEVREDVFKPFFRLEESRNPRTGGVGLGLTIARDLARSHGGEVILDDSPMGGLRVCIRLPM